jgi:hypothetical protein
MRLTLALLLVASSAYAKPLPKGMTVTFKKDVLYVTQDGITVPLRDDAATLADQLSEYKSTELSDDGTEVVVKINSCNGGEEGLRVPLAEVTARLENLRGMRLHLKKKYADAIPHFAAAAQGDPGTPVYASNLLSAQSMAKLLDDADATLAKYAPKHLAWFAWRLAVDKELANVRARPAAKALVAAKPGKLKADALGDAIAVSPTGVVAVHEWAFYGGPGAPTEGFDLALYDPAQDVGPVRLTGIAPGDACEGMDIHCTKAQKAKQAASKKKLDPVLAGMAFEKRPTVWVSTTADGSEVDVVSTPDKSSTAKFSTVPATGGYRVDVLHGKAMVTVTLDDFPKQVGFAGNIVVFQFRQNAYIACDGDAQRSYSKVVVVE